VIERANHTVALYLAMSQHAHREMRIADRDRLLVIAATVAEEAGQPIVAAHCRQMVLARNPGHMLRRWPDVTSALLDEDFQHLVRQHKRRYPVERAESVLERAGIEIHQHRKRFDTDEQFLASLLGVDWEWLAENYEP